MPTAAVFVMCEYDTIDDYISTNLYKMQMMPFKVEPVFKIIILKEHMMCANITSILLFKHWEYLLVFRT